MSVTSVGRSGATSVSSNDARSGTPSDDHTSCACGPGSGTGTPRRTSNGCCSPSSTPGEVLGSDDLSGEAGLHHPAQQAVLVLDRLGPRADLIVQLVVAHRWLPATDATVGVPFVGPVGVAPADVFDDAMQEARHRRTLHRLGPLVARRLERHRRSRIEHRDEEVGERSVCVGDHCRSVRRSNAAAKDVKGHPHMPIRARRIAPPEDRAHLSRTGVRCLII